MTFAKYGLLGYVFWISFLNLLDSDLKLLISIVSEFVSGQLLRFSILILKLKGVIDDDDIMMVMNLILMSIMVRRRYWSNDDGDGAPMKMSN